MTRREPRGAPFKYALMAAKNGLTKKPAKELHHQWMRAEKRRDHKRERREAREQLRREEP